MAIAPSSDTKLVVLNEHYNTTNTDNKKLGRTRDLFFIAVIVFTAALTFSLAAPDRSQAAFGQLIKLQYGISTVIGLSILTSLLWFSVLFAAIRYFQTVITLEKGYNYIHQIEAELSKFYPGQLFTREGVSYLKNYPFFSEWVNFVYRIIFPITLMLITGLKISYELNNAQLHILSRIFDTAIFMSLVVSGCLYMFSMYKIEKLNASNIPS
jgi:hypothetical protein